MLTAAVVILAHTASFPDIEKLMIKESPAETSATFSKVEKILGEKITPKPDNSQALVDNILNKFPGSTTHEVE